MNQKNLSTAKIGAILLFATAALRIMFILSNEYSNLSGMSWIYYLGTVALGVGLLMNNYLVSIISSAICAFTEVYWVFQEIKDEDIWQGILYEFSYLIAFVLLIVLMLPYLSNSMSKEVHKLWYLPGAILVVGYMPLLFYNIKYSYNYLTESFKYVFVTLLFITGLFLIGHGICDPSAASSASIGQSIQVSSVQSPTSSPLPTTTISQTASAVQDSFSSNTFEMLRKYKELLDGGVLTQEEFDKKKKELLG